MLKITARRLARKHIRALAEMKASAASLAVSVGALVPAGHCITGERLEKAADDLGREFLDAARQSWLEVGMSPEAIETIGPLVQQTFVTEFKTKLRAALPLHNLSIEGHA